MNSPTVDHGSAGARRSDSVENSRLLEKYKSLVLEHLNVEELNHKLEGDLRNERGKVEIKEKGIQRLRETTSEQKNQLAWKDKLIDELKASMAKMEIDFSKNLETEKKARRLQTSAVENECFLKLEQRDKVLTKLRKGEEEMKNEILKRDTIIREQATKLESDREKLRKLEEKCNRIEENLNSEKEEFKLLQIQLEKKVTECSTYKTSAKKHEETIEALKKQLLDRENSQKRLEKMLKNKQSQIATLKDFVEEREKTRLEEGKKYKRLCCSLSSQEDSDFDENSTMSVEGEDDHETEEAHSTSSFRDNYVTDNTADSIISDPMHDKTPPPLKDQVNQQSGTPTFSNSPQVLEGAQFEASSSSFVFNYDAAGDDKAKTNESFPCNICKEAFLRHCDRVKHLRRVHKLKNGKAAGQFGCRTPGCGALLVSLKALRQHKRLAHNNDQSTSKSRKERTKRTMKTRGEASSTGNDEIPQHSQGTLSSGSAKHAVDKSRSPRFICTCGKEFKLKNYLAAHINRMTLEKKFACDICGEKFVSYGNANAHKRSKHGMDTGPKGNIGCNFCGILFPSKRCYAQHRIKKFINGKISEVYCPSQTPESRSVETDSANDSANETPEMDGPFPQQSSKSSITTLRLCLPALKPQTFKFLCKKCGKGFLKAELLSKHNVSVHKNIKNNFISCKICCEVFPTNMELYHHHKMTHNLGSQLEPWERMPVGTSYPVIQSVSAELNSQSDDDDNASQAEQQQVANVQAETHQPVPLDPLDTASEKRHKCSCGEMYIAKNALRLHIQSKANGKRFKCSWCSLSFDVHCSLKKHVIGVHKSDLPRAALARRPAVRVVARVQQGGVTTPGYPN